jgi:2-polyprenyl-6-hydroxyphenyl methylase/3-demethylubiquinone-9 3-methyltransferase
MNATTANPDEIAQFARLADKWWDADGEFRPLHQLNPARMGYICNRLCAHFDRDPKSKMPLQGLSLVDVGCGGGLLTEPMCRLGATVTGIDAGAETIDAARHHAKAVGLEIDYRHILPEDMGRERRKFDVVLNMEVVEHVADRALFLKTAANLMKPRGAMVLSTLNRTLKSLALAKIGAEYVLRWVPAGTHDWRKFVRPSELANELEPHGMKVRDLTGLGYNPVDGSWRESRDLNINYMMFATKAT